MGSIPSNLTRVPTFLASQVSLRGLTNTSASLARLQQQLTTGLRINQPSDDPIAGSLISVLDAQLETAGQRSRNLNHATSVLNTLDTELGGISALILDAKEIASSQVGIGSDTTTRREQATIVTSLIDQLVLAANSDYAGISVFGGGRTGVQPIEFFRGGYRYNGDDGGLHTDLGPGLDFPITLPADTAIGSLSSRVEGSVDLNPSLTAGTRIGDLRGPAAGNSALELGSVTVTIDVGGTPTDIIVDLSQAETIGDITDTLESEIRTAVPGSLAGGFPGGVTFNGDRFVINAAPTVTITFDAGTTTPGQTARALGLDSFAFTPGTTTNPDPGVSLNPRVTTSTALSDLNPANPLAFGDIVFRNGDQTGTVTTTPGMTIGELQQAVERLDLGLRVEISESGNGIDVISEISGVRAAVEEGGALAATTLGIRSFDLSTELSVFNDGRGVEIADGATRPDGTPDAAQNTDFEVTLSDGTTFIVDLVPADTQDVGTIINAINSAAAGAGIVVGSGAGNFQATLSTGGNGLVLEDRLGGPSGVQVTSLNGFAAEDLGLLSGTSTPGNPAQLVGEDRATVRVNSLLTTLLDLRRALDADDQRGITFAGERLESEVDRVVAARALVGGRTGRIEASQTRLEDRVLLDQRVKSDLQDLDFIDASTRFTQLQTQLQASLTVTAQVSQLSLLNFL